MYKQISQKEFELRTEKLENRRATLKLNSIFSLDCCIDDFQFDNNEDSYEFSCESFSCCIEKDYISSLSSSEYLYDDEEQIKISLLGDTEIIIYCDCLQ